MHKHTGGPRVCLFYPADVSLGLWARAAGWGGGDITFGKKQAGPRRNEGVGGAERQEAGGKWWEWSQHLSTSPQDFAVWTCNAEERRQRGLVKSVFVTERQINGPTAAVGGHTED